MSTTSSRVVLSLKSNSAQITTRTTSTLTSSKTLWVQTSTFSHESTISAKSVKMTSTSTIGAAKSTTTPAFCSAAVIKSLMNDKAAPSFCWDVYAIRTPTSYSTFTLTPTITSDYSDHVAVTVTTYVDAIFTTTINQTLSFTSVAYASTCVGTVANYSYQKQKRGLSDQATPTYLTNTEPTYLSAACACLTDLGLPSAVTKTKTITDTTFTSVSTAKVTDTSYVTSTKYTASDSVYAHTLTSYTLLPDEITTTFQAPDTTYTGSATSASSTTTAHFIARNGVSYQDWAGDKRWVAYNCNNGTWTCTAKSCMNIPPQENESCAKTSQVCLDMCVNQNLQNGQKCLTAQYIDLYTPETDMQNQARCQFWNEEILVEAGDCGDGPYSYTDTIFPMVI